jgi:hypothetical protein
MKPIKPTEKSSKTNPQNFNPWYAQKRRKIRQRNQA